MNDAPAILGGAGVTAWLTLEQAQTGIAVAVGVLTLAVLIQRIIINCRNLRRGRTPR
jgi:hypothetical protein